MKYKHFGFCICKIISNFEMIMSVMFLFVQIEAMKKLN